MRRLSGEILSAGALRAALLGFCWWAISEGDPEAATTGLIAVPIAVAISLRIHSPQPISIAGLLRFIPVFLWRSLVGGVDVAARALIPALPVEPSLLEYRTTLPVGLPRVVFANVISLLPGTLSADLQENVLQLHILSTSAGDEADLRRLEGSVARIFT